MGSSWAWLAVTGINKVNLNNEFMEIRGNNFDSPFLQLNMRVIENVVILLRVFIGWCLNFLFLRVFP